MNSSIPSSPRQERIKQLESSIRQKADTKYFETAVSQLLVAGIPENEFQGISTFRELYKHLDKNPNEDIHTLFIEWLLESREPSQEDRVLSNMRNTRNSSRILLLGNADSDPAYQTLHSLAEAIWDYPNPYSEEDEHTEEMGKGWATDFVEGVQEKFQKRQSFPDIDRFDGEYVNSELSMQEQYVLLRMISARNPEVRQEIFRRVCMILPSNMGFSWDWSDVRDIYNEVVDEKRGLKIKE